ncbi:MAG: hypothetical protein ACUVRP_06150 [Chlorobiales bacterium]
MPIELYGARFNFIFQVSNLEESERIMLADPRFTDVANAAIHNAMPFASRLIDICDSLNFPDWLRLKLVGEIAKRASKKNNSKVFTAMILLRAMGYNAGIILISKQWRLTVEIDQKIFFATVFEEQKKRYAIYDIDRGELIKDTGEPNGFYDANENLGRSLEPLALFQDGFPTLPYVPITKTITWKFGIETYRLTYTLNRNMVKYLEERPQTDVSTYFNESISSEIVQSVVEPLKKIVQEKGFHARQAVAFLHAFVLNGFAYKDDLKTKRGEHTSSIHETLVSDFSDCEDRSILLAALIRGVLGFEVVALEFPNHITLGVHFPDFIPDEQDEVYAYNGKRYLSSDPSCFGTLGNANPDFKGKNPIRFIRVEPLTVFGAGR